MLKKLLSKEFLFIVGNTASVCVLFMILYLRKDRVEVTRTFSYLMISPISEGEIYDFLKQFEKPVRVDVRLNDCVIISNQQKFSFEIKFYDKKSDDEFVEKLKKEFEFYFQLKLISKDLIKDKKLPQVIYEVEAGAFVISNSNGSSQKVPAFISLTSTSVTSEGLKVFNSSKVENAEMVEIKDHLRILMLVKKSKYSIEKDVPLLSIGDGDHYLYFEVVQIK